MRTQNKTLQAFVAGIGLVAVPAAFAQFDDLQNYGDARTDGGGPGTFTDNGGGSYSITTGGADFWGNQDQASFLTSSDGSLTTTSDFTATVRHVGTTNVTTNDWGRDPLMMRAQPASGAPLPLDNPIPDAGQPNNDQTNPQNGLYSNSPHYMTYRRSGGATAEVDAGWRNDLGAGTTDFARNGGHAFGAAGETGGGGTLADHGLYMAIGRNGAELHSGYAEDISFGGAGTPGRWVGINMRNDHPNIGAGTEVTIGIGHQSHSAVPGVPDGGNAQNTATFDSFSYNNGSFDGSKFGALAADYAVAGSVAVDPNGAVSGAAYTFENGAATGEATGWRVTAQRLSAPQLGYGVAYQTFDLAAADTSSLVPEANFRTAPGSPGINADIYLAGNAGSLAGNLGTINGNAPNGSTVIPNVWWTGPGNGPADGYPDAGGVGGADNHGGANDTNLFAEAVQPGPGGAFEGNQDDYGVHMTGEIFIPGGTGGTVAFEAGIDDYKYLKIDGQELMDNNSWTGQETTQNAGGTLALFDSSGIDPAGEWVSFEMIMWEGGGGDTSALYWDASGGAGFDENTYPTFQTVEAELTISGTNQVGSDVATGAFGTLPVGTWDSVTLEVLNTGGYASQTLTGVTVVPEPGAIALIALSGFAFIFRRRK